MRTGLLKVDKTADILIIIYKNIIFMKISKI
jgi:hypothetical protein